MAWEQCPWCPEKQNGVRNREKHRRATHPVEYARLELETSITRNNDIIKYYSGVIAEYEEYSRFLATVSGYPLVRAIVMRKLLFLGEIDRHREYLRYSEEEVPQRQAALEAFDLAQAVPQRFS